MSFIAAVSGQFGKLFHVLMTGGSRIPIAQAATSGELLNSCMEQACEESMLESLMKVANFPKFVFDPTGFNLLLKAAQHSSGKIIFLQRLESGLRGQHTALDRQMNAFEALRVEEAGRVA